LPNTIQNFTCPVKFIFNGFYNLFSATILAFKLATQLLYQRELD